MRGHENLALLYPILYRERGRHVFARPSIRDLEEEMSTEERRAPGATRTPFDALVEVGGALGPTFEAQAVNVSEEGIQLRTAYLPEPGQPLTCRFDGGPGHSVLASGEVAWAQGAERGGEFGVRFTEIDSEGVEALKRICGVAPVAAPAQAGARVRLHIDGLASPMRAKIRDSHPSAVTVGSDLGFLQVGRQLELEDAQSGAKRPACIDRVDVAVDPSSQVPQLVVTLRYSDMAESSPSSDAASAPSTSRGRGPVPTASASAAPKAPRVQLPLQPAAPDDLAAVENASLAMKGALARGIDQIGPALSRFADQAKTMVGVLAQRRAERGDDASASRRTTAPAPNGGLHTTGRRVFRGESSTAPEREEVAPAPRHPLTGRRAAVAGGVMIAAILGALALKRAHHETAPVVAGPADSAAAAASAPPSPSLAPSASVAMAEAAPPAATTPPSLPSEGDVDSDGDKAAHHKHVHVAPFANGPVHHGNILRLKMDSAIEAIEGAAQPTGFTVKIPGRKALEAAAPLAARDARIAAIKVSNGTAGAELTVAFKDGVPTYRVSAKGDTLVIALAPPGPLESEPTMAKKDEKGGQSPTHARHAHDRSKSGDEAL
jgi:hypothetical protein